MKKALSIILAVVITVSLFASVQVTAFTTDYETEDNDNYSVANILSANSSINGSCSDYSDVDYYKFTITKAGKTDIKFSYNYADGYWWVRLYKYDNGLDEMISESVDANQGSYFSFPSLGLENGTYYIKIVNGNSVEGVGYTVSNTFTKTDDWETEANDNYTKADPLTLNKAKNGNIYDMWSVDYYKFSLSAAGTVDISFSHKYASNAYWWVKVYKYEDTGSGEGLKLVEQEYCDGDRTKTTLTRLGLDKGLYYIKISGGDSDSQNINYQIMAKYTKTTDWETEFNDDYTSADKISIGDTKYGNMHGESNDDYYNFSVSSTTKIKISVKHQKTSSGHYYIRLYKIGDSLKQIESVCISSSGGTYSLPIQKLSKGKYSLLINGDSATHGLKYSVSLDYYVDAPSSFKVSTRNQTSLKLNWKKSSGATGYELQQKVSGSWKKIKTTSSTSYTVKNLKSGTTQYFRVRAYKTVSGRKIYSSWKGLTTTTKPSTPSIKTPATSKKSITAKWGKVSSGSGYQIQISRYSSFKKITASKHVSGKDKTSYKKTNLKKGTKYYIRVRAYKTLNGNKYYGSWSKVRSIKCK